ncbi:MAG TPA: DinB family protein [Ktedonobacterales bacterium]
MSETNVTLAIMTEGWKTYQSALSKALAPLSAEQLALRAAPHLHSIDELACHIIAVRAGWYHDILREGDDAFDALSYWDVPGNPTRSASELVNGLALTWQVMREALARYTPTDLQVVFEEEREGQTSTYTRGWVVWHVIEHDLHHGGEIGYSLGMHGLEALDI